MPGSLVAIRKLRMESSAWPGTIPYKCPPEPLPAAMGGLHQPMALAGALYARARRLGDVDEGQQRPAVVAVSAHVQSVGVCCNC